MPSVQAQRIIEQLQAFVATDTGDNERTLELILRDLPRVDDPKAVLRSIFGVMERYPEADLGSPGSLVHETEAVQGYESYLAESLARQPSMLGLWMANRILNAIERDELRLPWLVVLSSVANSSTPSEALRQEAARFLLHQGNTGAA